MTDHTAMAEEREERLRLIRDSAASLVPRGGDLGRVRRLRFQSAGVDRDAWGEVCAMGWPGLRLAEELGGSGLGMAEYTSAAGRARARPAARAADRGEPGGAITAG